MGTLKTTPGKSLKQLEYNYPAYIMLRGPNLVLKKRLRPLFSTYFGKKGLISKILLRSMLAARHFFTENGRKRALFSSFSTRKRLQNQPACHSYLTELLHVDIRWKLVHFC